MKISFIGLLAIGVSGANDEASGENKDCPEKPEEKVPVAGEADTSAVGLKEIFDIIGSADSFIEADKAAAEKKKGHFFPYRYRHCGLPLEWKQDLADMALEQAKCFGTSCPKNQPSNVSMLSSMQFPTTIKGNMVTCAGGNAAMRSELKRGFTGWYNDADIWEGCMTTVEICVEALKKFKADKKNSEEDFRKRTMYAKMIWTGAEDIGCAWASNPETAKWEENKTKLTEEQKQMFTGKLVCLFRAPSIAPGTIVEGTKDPDEGWNFFRQYTKPPGFQVDRKACGDPERFKEKSVTTGFKDYKEAFLKVVNNLRRNACADPLQYDDTLQDAMNKAVKCYSETGKLGECNKNGSFDGFKKDGNLQSGIVARKITCPEENSDWGCGPQWDDEILQAANGMASWLKFFQKVRQGDELNPTKENWQNAHDEMFKKFPREGDNLTTAAQNDDEFKVFQRFVQLMWGKANKMTCGLERENFAGKEFLHKAWFICAINASEGVVGAKNRPWKDELYQC